jgi:hypothetical protein
LEDDNEFINQAIKGCLENQLKLGRPAFYSVTLEIR